MELEQQFCRDIFKMKYMINGEEDIYQVFRDIAKEIASVEKKNKREQWAEEFYSVMVSREFIAAGRQLANARPYSKMKNYGNCYVTGVSDSLPAIYDTLKKNAIISAMGGGVGFNISPLRPKDAPISKGGESSGPMSFLDIFDASAKTIRNGGGRRAASISIMDISHPDVEEFITYKQGDKNKKLTSFNISVGITKEFIEAWKNDGDWDLVFGDKVYKTVRARELFTKLAQHAFYYNEPGLLFYPSIDYRNFGWYAEGIGKIRACNPCGEQALPVYGICNLSSINLSQLVRLPFTKDAYFDWLAFNKCITVGIRFLDNVIDAMDYPLPEIKELQRKSRRVGLGITGLASAMAMLGFDYGSDESVEFTDRVGYELRNNSVIASSLLAREKGKYPLFDYDKYIQTPMYESLGVEAKWYVKRYGMRNIALNTVAPVGTGSLAVGMNCSSGIEPIFAKEYTRKVRVGDEGDTITETIYEYSYLMAKSLGVEPVMRTVEEIDPLDAMKVQAAMQKHLDSNISKTYNLPTTYTLQDYENLIMASIDAGLSGFTSFNPKGYLAPILSTKKEEKVEEKVEEDDRPVTFEKRNAPKRPKDLPCDVQVTQVKGKKYVVLVGLYGGEPYEVFATELQELETDPIRQLRKQPQGIIRKVKKGHYALLIDGETVLDNIAYSFNTEHETLNRLLSVALRHGTPIEFAVDQLSKSAFGTWGKMMAVVLKRYIGDGRVLSTDRCENCGAEGLVFEEGCKKCPECGWSKC